MRKELISLGVLFLTVASISEGRADEVQPSAQQPQPAQTGFSGGGAEDMLNYTKPMKPGAPSTDEATKEGADRLAIEAQKAESVIPSKYNNGVGTGNGVSGANYPNTH